MVRLSDLERHDGGALLLSQGRHAGMHGAGVRDQGPSGRLRRRRRGGDGRLPRPAGKLREFADKHALPFTLLSDPDHKVAEKYGVWVEKSMYGRSYMGVQRATFVIGPDGKISRRFEGHAQEARRAGAGALASYGPRPSLVAPPPGRHLGVLVLGVGGADRDDLGALGPGLEAAHRLARHAHRVHVFSSTTSSSSFMRALPLTIT